MGAVVRAADVVCRAVRTQLVFLFAGAFAGMIALGSFRSEGGLPGWPALAALALWGVLFARAVWLRFRQERDVADMDPAASDRSLRLLFLPRARLDLEIGALLIVLTLAVIEIAGGARSPWHPVLYLLIAFFVCFYPWLLGLALTVTAAALDAILVLVRFGLDRDLLLMHGVFIAVFATLNLAFTRTEIFRLRRRGETRLRHALERVREAARDFRLSEAVAPAVALRPSAVYPAAGDGAAGPGGADRRARDPLSATVAAVHQIQETLVDTLELLRQTLSLRTCVALVVDRSRSVLKIAEIATDAKEINWGPFGVSDGVAGAAMRAGAPVSMGNLRPDYRGLPYYRNPLPVRSFLAVPFRDGEEWRGVLVADRTDPEVFSDRDRQILVRAAERVARTIQNERAFLQLERTKREQGQLLIASERLSGAIREDEVVAAALEAARGLATIDFAAVVACDERAGRFVVLRAEGERAEELGGLSFEGNQSLVALAVRTRHYMPYRGDFDGAKQAVFEREGELDGMSSLLVLPLVVQEKSIGALVVAARRRGAFRHDVLPLLQVLANQVATSLLNARMVRRLAEMATTDGLTGLSNRRTFDSELDRQVRSAERYRKPLSLLMCDIDFFKGINDTHGHKVGDEVLKGFARVLLTCKRDTDIVARYGGEEFAILCENTDTGGAHQLAERVRQELSQRSFASKAGPLRVTCSIGVATFPVHAKNRDDLVRAADQALYCAKRSGRNRTVIAGS